MSSYVENALEDALSKDEKNESTKKILDSGSRRQFESGAVRDIQEGKGRCDLLPLNEISDFISEICLERKMEGDNRQFHIYSDILTYLNDFMIKGDKQDIYRAVLIFAEYVYKDPFTAIIELSKHYEEGAKKYEERNWERGISCHCFVDSGIRHLTKYFRGDEDESHERAFLWNMFGLVWTIENRPECNDLPYTVSATEKTAEIINDDGSITKKCQRCGRYFKTMHKNNTVCSVCKDIVNGGPD